MPLTVSTCRGSHLPHDQELTEAANVIVHLQDLAVDRVRIHELAFVTEVLSRCERPAGDGACTHEIWELAQKK